MIKGVIVVNNQGKPRVLRFYDGTSHSRQQFLLRQVFSLVSRRRDAQGSSCCIIRDANLLQDERTQIIYRHFATLYFVVVADDAESELGILDLIHVFVQVLDACFANVCELDLIYHFDKVNYILDEIVVGGCVMETNVESILSSVGTINKLVQSEESFFG